jgi:hypothetical protein
MPCSDLGLTWRCFDRLHPRIPARQDNTEYGGLRTEWASESALFTPYGVLTARIPVTSYHWTARGNTAHVDIYVLRCITYKDWYRPRIDCSYQYLPIPIPTAWHRDSAGSSRVLALLGPSVRDTGLAKETLPNTQNNIQTSGLDICTSALSGMPTVDADLVDTPYRLHSIAQRWQDPARSKSEA